MVTIEENKVYNMDCIKGMKKIDTDSFDVVFTDPPYNVGKEYDSSIDEIDEKSYIKFSKDWLSEAKRVSKVGVMFTPGTVNMKTWLLDIEYPKGVVVIHVPNQLSRSSVGSFNMWEPLLVYGKIKMKKNIFYHPIQKQQKKDVSNHPCPKHTVLWKDILMSLYPKPKSVLDPFMGSGTTGVACKMLGFGFLGFDISKKYCDFANKRIQKTTVVDRWL